MAIPTVLLRYVLAAAAACAASSCAPRRYSVTEEHGVHWLRDPGGKPFLSLAACVVDQGLSREAYVPAKPAYAAWRSYPDAASWAEATIARLRSSGFTTAGGWADSAALLSSRAMDLHLTPVLAAGMEAGAPWFDLWDPQVVARIETLARKRIAPVRSYPRLLGYFTDNEIGWWNGALFKMTLEHPASSGQRRRLVDLLRETYGGDYAALLRDFEPGTPTPESFAALEEKGVLYLREGGNGMRVLRRFLVLVAERYYQLLESIVRREDPGALVLGDRYPSFYYPEVAAAASRHVDLISTNLNAHFADGSFTRFFLDTLHEVSGKPVIVSEIYFAASENRSGDPNSHGLYPVARTQAERAAGARKTLEALVGLPYVAGVDWFQYYDEPPGGRFDGEDWNFGLVDIEDRPYEELLEAFRSLDASAVHRRASTRRAEASQGVPPAPLDPLGGFEPYRALLHWDRERGFVRPSSPAALADLYLAWDAEALYLGLYAFDPVEGAYYKEGVVPEGDRLEWTVEVPGAPSPIRLRLGAWRAPSGAPPGVEVAAVPGEKLGVRAAAALRVPASIIGRGRLEAGDRVRLRAAVSGHARSYRTEWSGEFPLAR